MFFKEDILSVFLSVSRQEMKVLQVVSSEIDGPF